MIIGAEVSRPPFQALPKDPAKLGRVAPVPYSGTAILDHDDPTVRRGSPFTFADGSGRTISGVVTRRLRLRNGNLKLWLDGVRVECRS